VHGLTKKLSIAAVLVVVAWAGFRWGDLVFGQAARLLDRNGSSPAVEAPPSPSPELADSTLARFERFREGKAGDRLAFGGTELTSVLRYAVPGIIPPGVSEPTLRLQNGLGEASAKVAVAAFPRLPRLEPVVGILPDTVLIEMRGSLVRIDERHLAFVVDRIQAAHIPLPQRMIGTVLDALAADRRDSIPEDALMVPLPDGLKSAFVQQDSLVLLAGR